MADRDDPQWSALVILHPADPSAATEPITSSNVAAHAPSEEGAAELMDYFGSTGFDIGPFAGISFSISGPRSRFRSVFGPDLPTGDRDNLEFDLGGVPARLRQHLRAVSFSEPLDFGPGSP